jgi:hypothetical protein
MRMIFEEDIENADFIEIILGEKDRELLERKGVIKEFPQGLFGKRKLNVYIRYEKGENLCL